MQTLWPEIRRYSRHIAAIPVLLGIALTILTGRSSWLEIGAVWFLGVIAVQTATETFIAVRRRLPPRRRRGALVEFLRTGGYSFAAASMAAYFAVAFWTPYRPSWLMGLVLGGILMCFSSALVYKRRSRKSRAKHN
jgi:hypothetical protein